MLSLRPIIALVAIILLPSLAIALVLRESLDPAISLPLAVLMGVASLRLFHVGVWKPLRLLRIWRAFAKAHDYEFFGTLSHEPIIRGKLGDRRFVAGISAAGRESESGRYRTVISAPVEAGVPVGARIYARSNDLWITEYSRKLRVPTGNLEIEEVLRCEGSDSELLRTYVSRAKLRLIAFVSRYPTMIIHGSISSELPAEPGGASGLVTISLPGRLADMSKLAEVMDDACELAGGLDERSEEE